MNEPILAAKGEHELLILPEMANRHGLISGATGTGKTVTLQVLAENFSMIGVPVFMADVMTSRGSGPAVKPENYGAHKQDRHFKFHIR
jgi:MoxR-like ATPase